MQNACMFVPDGLGGGGALGGLVHRMGSVLKRRKRWDVISIWPYQHNAGCGGGLGVSAACGIPRLFVGNIAAFSTFFATRSQRVALKLEPLPPAEPDLFTHFAMEACPSNFNYKGFF